MAAAASVRGGSLACSRGLADLHRLPRAGSRVLVHARWLRAALAPRMLFGALQSRGALLASAVEGLGEK